MIRKLQQSRGAAFGLDELVEAAGGLLAESGLAVEDGRVGAALDARTVRYYQTFGLVDRPQRFEGRQAIYGYRHLVQLLAIRTLQAQRMPLALIQQVLAGQTTAQLEARIAAGLDGGARRVAAANAAVQQPAGAVTQAPTDGGAEVLAAAADAGSGQRDLLAGEVFPGVMVIVDPQKVADPRGVLERIRACFPREDM